MVKNGNFTLHNRHCYWNFNYEGSYLPGVLCNIVVKLILMGNVFRKSSQLGQVCPNITCQIEVTKIRCELKFSVEVPSCYWHLVVMNGNFTLLLTSSGHRMAISHCYWHLVVKNSNLTLLLTSISQQWGVNFTLLMTSSCQECQFHIATEI